MGKRVEHVELFVVFGVDHGLSLQGIEIARIVCHKNTSNAIKINQFYK
jgi:hypothetical protein